MNQPRYNQPKALRFRQFTRKGWALFACLGRVVTIGVLSAATLQSATAAHRHVTTDRQEGDSVRSVDKEATLDDVEVTGTRAPLALGQAAARMVSVLTRDDIQAASVQSINDLLKMAVGVDVRQRGPIGAQTDIGIRGSTAEQITILLNGISICDPQTAHNAFDLPCDLSDIVRIEVLEGPAGRACGTSSLVGAINVVTRGTRKEERGTRNEERGTSHARLEGGSFGYLSTAARVSHLSSIVSHLSTCFTRSDGYSRAKSGALNSDFAGAKAFYQGGYAGNKVRLDWHAGLSAKGFGSNTFYSARYDEQYERTTKLFTALQGETAGWLHLRPAVYWNRSYDRFELVRGQDGPVPFNRHRTDVIGMNVNSHFDTPLGRTAIGGEVRHERIVSTNLGEPRSHGDDDTYRCGLDRTNVSLHLEHNVMLRRLTLSAGFIAARNTWNGMPFRLYPGIDASLRVADGLRLYASYNSSLRLPSFTELYYSVGGHKADKHLKAEELQAVEGGVRYTRPGLTVKGAVFHHHARNMIDWVMDTRESDPVWQSVNHTRLNTLGEELTVQTSLNSQFLNIFISYCHLHQSKALAPHLQSQYALEYLRHKLVAQLRLQPVERLEVTLGYRFQDRRGSYTDTQGSVQSYRPYSLVDSRLAYRLTRALHVYVEANNLLDHQYVDYGNVPQPGFWLMAGVRWGK